MSKKNGNNNHTVTCSSGMVVHTRPISIKLLEQFDKYHQQPKPPLVESVAIGGTVELVENPDDPEYRNALAEYNKKTGDEFIAMILDLGMESLVPTDESWVKRLKRVGIAVPDDPDDKNLMYIQTFIMPDFMTDFRNIAAAVLRQSGVEEEAIASWTELF